jgi:hypothetical protein
VAIISFPWPSFAQKDLPLVAVPVPGTAKLANERIAAIRKGMRDVGLAKGVNYAFAVGFADGVFDRLPGLAQYRRADILGSEMGISRPSFWEDIAMKASLLFVAGMSQTATPSGATTSLPSVLVEAPVARPQKPKQRAVARSTVSPRTSPSTPTPSASPMSVAARLAKLANTTGSCVDGCQTSFRSGDAPWHGCSVSAGTYSPTCRNAGNFKTYAECTEVSLLVGWRGNETSWYCSSMALK